MDKYLHAQMYTDYIHMDVHDNMSPNPIHVLPKFVSGIFPYSKTRFLYQKIGF